MAERVSIALCAALLLAALAGSACARGPRGGLAPELTAKMNPALRRVAAAGSDTTVGVFIRTSTPTGAAERRRLEGAGVAIGTVTGDLLTGRVTARRLRDVAALSFVTYIELAVSLRPNGDVRPRSAPHSPDGTA